MAMFDDDGEFLPSYDWQDFDQSEHGFGSPFGDAQPPEESIQGEQSEPNESWTWRCLACDAVESSWQGSMWVCSQCGSTDFYKTNSAAKKMNDHGTWMYLPFDSPEQGRDTRRRRRRRQGGPPGGSPHGSERAESEKLTHDPCVDPDLPPGPRGHPEGQRGASRGHQPPSRRDQHSGLSQGASRGAASTEDQLLQALRKLVVPKRDEEEWQSAAGPQKGVRWRGGQIPQPPLWRYDREDVRAYTKYCKKVAIWQLQAAPYVSPKEMSLLLYNSLQGEAEQELEHTSIEEIHRDDGVQVILQALKAPMEQKVVYQKRRFLHEFEVLRRFSGENMRAYINRFRRSQRLLKSVGIDISHTYDSESLGARLLDRCGLSQEAQRMILVGTGQKLEFEALAEAMLLQYPDFRGAPPVTNRDGVVQQPKGLGKGSSKGSKSSSSLTSSTASFSSSSSGKGSGPRKQVHLTEVPEVEDGGDEFLDTIDENDDDQQNDDDAEAFDDQQEQPGDEDYDDSPDLGELAEVLTLTAKKLSGITLGRKFSGRPDKKPKGQSKGSIADKKRVTHCSACGGKGHWHDDPECPLNSGKGGQSQPRDKTSAATSSSSTRVNKVGIIHHEHGATDVLAAPSSYGNLFTVQMVQHPPQLPHDVNEVSINGPEGFAGYMILDTGCQRTCCGELWFQAHTKRLRDLNLHPRVIEFPDSFKFGKGAPSNSQVKMYTPSAIEGVPLLLAASILSEKIPFLASNSLMTELGAVFNTVDDVIVFARLEGAKAKIHRIGGHMALCITEFLHDNPSSWSAWHEFSRSTVWTSPHPEFILSTQTHPVDLPVALHRLLDDSTSSSMVEGMAADRHSHEVSIQEHGDQHAAGDQSRHGTKELAVGNSATAGFNEGPSQGLPPQQVQAVRPCSRPLRRLPGMRNKMDLEQGQAAVGGPLRSRGDEVTASWVKKSLFAIAAFASAFFNDHSTSGSNAESRLHQPTFGTSCSSQDTTSIPSNINEWNLDQFLPDGAQLGPSQRGELHAGVEHHGGAGTLHTGTSELCRARLLQRGGLCRGAEEDHSKGRSGKMEQTTRAGSYQHRGQRDLRLGTGESLKPGQAKRIRGQWLRSAKLMEAEHEVYHSQPSTQQRPPPSVDLWELFAGQARCSELAHEYDLTALQPMDIVYGQDFFDQKVRSRAKETLDRFRPTLLMIETDCTHFTLFNKNLNYSQRLDEWHRLQQEDQLWLTPEERINCTPIEGSLTSGSQAYPEQMCRTILGHLREYVKKQQPTRFCLFSQAVEVEDLGDLQFPRQRFSKPVRYAIFAYGHRRLQPEPSASTTQSRTPTMVPNLPTDIDFPDLSKDVPQEVKSAVARLHLNLGHPSRQELSRLLAYEGNFPDAVHECARKLRCSTCERLKPKQPPRPSTQPSMVVGQFGDELQMDIFYCKTLASETFMVLGMVDRATGLHQAIILPDRNSETTFDCFEKVWLRPFGLPIHLSCDPDKSFRGSFESRVQAMGCIIEHCPPEAHYVIGMVERRNALLRIILEKLIDQFAASTVDQCSALLAAACHAINAGIHTHGRSAYQAVFGRQPRLLGGNFNDPMALATSPSTAQVEQSAGFRAEFIRCEALKRLHELDCSQHLRRALLRKTRTTKIADLQPGQACAYWRWTRRGAKKRGGWVMARFLSWDPSHVGKQAWLRTGASTTLVTAEQLRAAFGFEDWVPDKEDVKALKDAATKFESFLDDRGPDPPQDQLPEDGELEWPAEQPDAEMPMTPSMAVLAPSTPAEPSSVQQPIPSQQPHTPTLLPLSGQQQLSLSQQQISQQQSVQFHIDSPTNINQMIQQQYHRYGTVPERSRRRSRTPTLKRYGSTAAASIAPQQQEQQALPQAEQTALAEQPALHDAQHPPAEQTAGEEFVETSQTPAPVSTQQEVSQHATILDEQQTEPNTGDTQQQQAITDTQQVVVVPDDDVQQVSSSASSMSTGQLPQKRPFDTMFALVMDEQGNITTPDASWDGSPPIGFGPAPRLFHKAYLSSSQRLEDVKDIGKAGDESDTSQESDDDDFDAPPPTTMTAVPVYKQGMSRQELKALDREIPWRRILEMSPSYIDKFIEAVIKESESWATWESVQPIEEQEANRILADPILKKRCIRSRACYRDKALGVGEVRAKCRIVALGHTDPDLAVLTRHTPTPGRTAEHVVYASIVAGYNCQLFNSHLPWRAWAGDAATAFLQGKQAERDLPLFILPPKDGIIALTNTWQHRLYQVRGNIYGLANAPFTWSREVIRRLESLSYRQHSFDKQLFYKVVDSQVVSLVLVYVDDFIGLHRTDHDISELHRSFKWGSLDFFEENKAVTFKGKELTVFKNENNRYVMSINMKKFIDGLDGAKLHRGRLQGLRLAPVVSLTAHGAAATTADLKNLYSAIDYLKETSHCGILLQDIPINEDTVVIGYADASWANARRSGSQIGALVALTTNKVLAEPEKVSVIDWKSARSPRVCRSTLAAEASAGDELSDRASYINAFISELVHQVPAHRVGNRLSYLQCTDAKSLYDCIINESPSVADKRTLVSVRAIQESVDASQVHWVPTRFQFADGLTKVEDKLRASFNRWLQFPMAVLVEHPSNYLLEDLYFEHAAGKKQTSKPAADSERPNGKRPTK
eukprot:symbB.v1.2.009030.t1/scaffold568.1/size186168/6